MSTTQPDRFTGTPPLPTEEILIVEDSSEIRNLLINHILPEVGFRSRSAATLTSARVKLRERLPDLLLLDLQLPDGNGLDLVRDLSNQHPDLPVIVMTAHGSEETAVEAFRLGVRNYLMKPFEPANAITAVNQALAESRLRRERDELTSSLQQRVRELQMINRIGYSVTSLMEVDQLLERIVDGALYVTQAEEAVVLLVTPDRQQLEVRAGRGALAQQNRGRFMAVDDPDFATVIRERRPQIVYAPQFGPTIRAVASAELHTILLVPLQIAARANGVLCVGHYRSDRHFNENDQLLLVTLADYAAVAIENAHLYARERAAERRLREIFESANDAIVTLDAQLQITNLNHAATMLFGEREAVVGHGLAEYIDRESWALQRGMFYQLLSGEAVTPFIVGLIPRGDHAPLLEVSGQKIAEQDDGSQLLCIARDLSERRRLEKQLAESERLVTIGQLISGVSHELNNPLTSISITAQVLQRSSEVNGSLRPDIDRIFHNASRSTTIVKRLLNFARQTDEKYAPTDIHYLLNEAIQIQAYELHLQQIQVTTDFVANLPETMVQSHELQQVFLNLILNARDALVDQPLPRHLTIATRLVAQANPLISSPHGLVRDQALEITISDNGPGVPHEIQAKIFDLFFTTKPAGKGTGLGLALSLATIEKHNGQFQLVSEVGHGATFMITLPLIIPRDSMEELTLSGLQLDQIAPTRVLIVDDDPEIGMVFERLFRNFGHFPLAVTSGAAALTTLAHEAFDLLIIDVRMPGENGVELATMLQQQQHPLANQIILMTGDTIRYENERPPEPSTWQYLAKPFTAAELAAVVAALRPPRSPKS